ncbi:hypothetical protein [Mesorhizobium sp. M1399]|uniref:hypothetical protein n=1 Tax=Mesorhizobium sp. M1399 TaxID=2957096 RepID=UPI0033350890
MSTTGRGPRLAGARADRDTDLQQYLEVEDSLRAPNFRGGPVFPIEMHKKLAAPFGITRTLDF